MRGQSLTEDTNIMETNDVRVTHNESQGHNWHGAAITAIGLALALAIGGDVYLWSQNKQLSSDISDMRSATAKQYTKLDATAAAIQQDSRERLEALQTALSKNNESSAVALNRLRAEARKQSDAISQKLAEANSQINGELSQLKDTTSSKFDAFSNDVSGVKTDVNGVKEQVASAQTAIEQHGNELKRMMGDMGVMSGLIATNSKDLNHLRELGDRNYVEFTLSKNAKTRKVGDMVLTYKKADAKRNRYTIEVQADDKRVEKKERTINEPVQIYMAGSRQPSEIVVNQVNKDQIVGYVAFPKLTTLSQR